ncbi:MAG TPA: protein translocase subunit SecD [Anaeromyxobacter sp.]|nr:protein translocase subunit SecD [Anaeromyxobacter sp.]
MERSWYWRFGLVVAGTLLCIYQLIPSWYYFKLPPEQRNKAEVFDKTVPRWAPRPDTRLNLGLDLQGGILLDMGVNVDKAVQAKVTRRADAIAERLNGENVPFESAGTTPDNRRVFVKTADPGKVQDEVLSFFGSEMTASRVEGGVQFAFKEQVLDDFRTGAVEQAEKVIRNRIDKWGVTEPDIKRKSNSQIQIQLPGAEDPEKAKDLLGRTAQLEFKIVDDESTALDKAKTMFPACRVNIDRQAEPPIPDGGCFLEDGSGQATVVAKTRDQLDKIVKEQLQPLIDPAKNALLTGTETVTRSSDRYQYERTYVLRAKTELTGDYLANADVGLDSDPMRQGEPIVRFEMSPEGSKLMGKLTQENIKKRMAIVLDERVESAPVIQSQITSNGQITLGSGRDPQAQREEAQMISLVLRSGALPAPVTIGAESTVGATLGPELIEKGTKAALLGLLMVLIFMVVYYRVSGLIADVALVLNGLLVLAAMAAIQTTLTLPGIAGFVLTLGMAVDANVLINERIREELRAGRSTKIAVQQGYARVFWTIIDSHVTTLVAGFMLMEFGTGPIRGFAVTLIIGLVASLITSIFVTRVLMEYFTRHDTAKLSV